ncbi:MAG: cytochrome c [Rhodomicrobium sp.]|nr:cytochrome c [Rhodomicrobium sp.]
MCILAAPLAAAPVPYNPPEETAKFRPGPGAEAANTYCLTCHSEDYVATQPRGPKFGKAFWQAEVTKMIKVMGAQIPEGDIKTIADYLSTAYEK